MICRGIAARIYWNGKMKKWENLLLVMDKPTERIVFRAPWKEWPQMIPSTSQHVVRNYNGWTEFSDSDWSGFRVAWPRLVHGLELYDENIVPIDSVTRDRLVVERIKSGLAWRWLNVLYSFDRSVSGMIPGIDVVDNEIELKLLQQERESVKKMIADDLKKNWQRIWEASSKTELDAIAAELKFEGRNSQGFA